MHAGCFSAEGRGWLRQAARGELRRLEHRPTRRLNRHRPFSVSRWSPERAGSARRLVQISPSAAAVANPKRTSTAVRRELIGPVHGVFGWAPTRLLVCNAVWCRREPQCWRTPSATIGSMVARAPISALASETQLMAISTNRTTPPRRGSQTALFTSAMMPRAPLRSCDTRLGGPTTRTVVSRRFDPRRAWPATKMRESPQAGCAGGGSFARCPPAFPRPRGERRLRHLAWRSPVASCTTAAGRLQFSPSWHARPRSFARRREAPDRFAPTADHVVVVQDPAPFLVKNRRRQERSRIDEHPGRVA